MEYCHLNPWVLLQLHFYMSAYPQLANLELQMQVYKVQNNRLYQRF